MKFWRWLAWLCTVGFLLVLVVSWLANGHHNGAPTPELNEPAPAPKFH